MHPQAVGMAIPALLLLALTGSAEAQDGPSAGQRLDAVDHAERQARLAVTGDLGLPELPPVRADSPRDDLLYADRFPVQASYAGACDPGPALTSKWLSAGQTGTGVAELFHYLVPADYDPEGAPVPMVIGYHGFGASAASVAAQSTLDEEAHARGWFFLSPTGLDDKLFGSPVCQQNIAAAVRWMLDEFAIDPDRLYMVGMSMGAGVVINFAARHRDPDDIMIAAVGTVSGTYDWTLTYNFSPGIQTLLENPYNFGGSVTEEPFRYQQASGLYFPPTNYPPAVWGYDLHLSMASNLARTPTYVAYDLQDPIPTINLENAALTHLLTSMSRAPEVQVEDGTVDPCSGSPAPHSWAVLDAPRLFNFLQQHTVDRHPAFVHAQLDRSTKVGSFDVTQAVPDAFSWFVADVVDGALQIDDVENAALLHVDAQLAGLTGAGPHPLDVTLAPGEETVLRLAAFDPPAAYLTDALTDAYLEGTWSDPSLGALVRAVGVDGLGAHVVTDPMWTGSLVTTPDPVAPGGSTQLVIDLPDTSASGFLVAGITEGIVSIPGWNQITAWPFSPSLLLPVTLDAQGDLSVPASIPGGPELSGARLYVQAIGFDRAFGIDAITNMWVLHIE